MAQFTIDTTATITNGQLVVTASWDNNSVASFLDPNEITTAQQLVEWVLNQQYTTRTTEADIQKRITFTAHQETDPGGGVFWVLDSIDEVVNLPRDDARAGIQGLPGWATWTAQEAADWIDINVTDLASAKVALSNMARMIVWLRDYVGV